LRGASGPEKVRRFPPDSRTAEERIMIIPSMTDQEFADWLRLTPRTVAGPEPEAGLWVANETVHHNYGESRQQ
jgi:hypothetical protein